MWSDSGFHKMQDPVRDDASFAGSGACDDEDGAVCGLDGPFLSFIEGIHGRILSQKSSA